MRVRGADCLIFVALTALAAGDRTVVILFGPGGAEPGRQAARASAAAARRWLDKGGSTVELRRAGNPEGLVPDPKLSSKQWEQAFLDTAREARESDLAGFLSSLEAAAQALGQRTGTKLIVVMLESPPLSAESENRLRQTTDICKENKIRVVVLDTAENAEKSPVAALQSLARETGGLLISSPRTLDSALLTTSAAPDETKTVTLRPAKGPSIEGNALFNLKVRTRFIRMTSMRTQSWGVERSFDSGYGGITTREGGANTERTFGPMRGYLTVEAPLSYFKFENNEATRTYMARAMVTQIARNEKGQAVWQARKEILVRGPLQKLEQRRAGNLYYMREIQLPAGQYTLEATVEDLLAGTSGSIREPLRTGDGLPGFNVSDALFVRPFNGSADRIEADQVFSYDGEAIAPVLAPEFRAGELSTLQLYFVIYPDPMGAKPEISFEILHGGRVVGRTVLPFTDELRDTSREGIGAMKGEQKRQFPYLATLKGVKLNAGEFEARVTVRQNRNVITRTVPFRVLGDGNALAEVAVGSNVPAAALAEESSADIVLPEIDPVNVNTAGPVLPAEAQKRVWDEAAVSALGYSKHLPNFRCNQETRRLTAPAKNPDQLRESDIILSEITYENGHEGYQVLEVNGLKASRNSKRLEGVRSRGEFGSMLKALFGPEVGAKYKWAGRAMAGGTLCRVFEVEVEQPKSNFVLYHNLRQEVAGYQGRVFIDEENGLVRRITILGSGLPKDFALQSPSMSLEYGMVRIGDEDHLLPLKSVLQVRQGKTLVRNETVFRNYHKFEASSQIKY